MDFSSQDVRHQQLTFNLTPSYPSFPSASSGPIEEAFTSGHAESSLAIDADSVISNFPIDDNFQTLNFMFDVPLPLSMRGHTDGNVPLFSAPPGNVFERPETFNATTASIAIRAPSPFEACYSSSFESSLSLPRGLVANGINHLHDLEDSLSKPLSRPTSAKSMPSIGRNPLRKDSDTSIKQRKFSEGFLHKKVEDRQDRFKCSCNEIFTGEKKKSARNNLQRHIEEKNNPKRWACIHRNRGCEYRGARKSNVRQHMKHCRKGNTANTSAQQPHGEPIDTGQL